MAEIWAVYPPNPIYEVSDLGQVRHATSKRVKKQRPNRAGYPTVTLHGSDAPLPRLVHRMVARTFVPCPDGNLEVCHNDGDRTNNRAENLRWDTHQANLLDAVRHGTNFHTRKTHCPRGHEYRGGNLRQRANGRWCRACSTERSRSSRAGEPFNERLADAAYARLMADG